MIFITLLTLSFFHIQIKKPIVNDLIEDIKYLQKVESRILKNLLDPEKTSTPEEFLQSFKRHIHARSEESRLSFREKMGIGKHKKVRKENQKITLVKSQRGRIKESESDEANDHEMVNLELWRELWKETRSNEESKHARRKWHEFIKVRL